jgi:uncharacterized membrane protein YvbJ
LVYCTKCGYKNDEKVSFCVECGIALYPNTNYKKKYNQRKQGCFGAEKQDDECFGLPHSSTIIGIIFGIIIIFFGIGIILERNFLEYLVPFMIIIVGSLFVIGSIYTLIRKKS